MHKPAEQLTGTASGFLPLKGTRLYYEVVGDGPPLVLVHSRWMHSGLWDEQVKAFAGQYRVIRYDMRGFGRSDMDLIPYSDTEDLYHLLQHLGITRASVLGLSMGGWVALEFAREHPDMMQTLIVAGEGAQDYEVYTDEFGQQWESYVDAVKAQDYARAMDAIVSMWVNGPFRPAAPAVVARTREMMRGHTFPHHRIPEPEGVEAGSAPPAEEKPPVSERERLSPITFPVLLMYGDKDWPEVAGSVRRLAEHLPQAETVVIPNAAHIANLEQPELFNRAVLDFLKKHVV